MVLHRRYQSKKLEAEMREQALLQDTVVSGVKNMRGNYETMQKNRQPVASTMAGFDLHSAGRTPSVDATADDLMFFSAAALSGSTQTPITEPEPQKIKSGGGSFDGGGASGDWERSSNFATDSGDSSSSSSSSSSSDSSSSSSSD